MDVIESSWPHKKNKLTDLLPLALLLLFIILFSSTFEGLYVRWIKWDESLSHGLLVNGVFVYLLYKSLPWETYPNGRLATAALYLGLATTSLAWFICHLSSIYILEQLLLLVLLAELYACSYGVKTIITLRLLLLLPIFTIPLWEQLTNSLVNLSGFVVGKMVRLVDIPAVIEGNSIFIPNGHIVIADGCSGLRYFEIALALAYIIGLLNNYNEKRLIPTLLIAAALGLLANWIRIFALVIIGYQSDMQSSLMSDHEYFGWALFALLCFPAIYFAPIVPTAAKQLSRNAFIQKPTLILPLCLLAIGPALSLFITAEPIIAKMLPTLSTNVQSIAANKMPIIITAPTHGFKENALIKTANTQIFVEIDQYQRIKNSDKLVPYFGRLYDNEEWLSQTSTININEHKANLTKLHQKSSSLQIMQLQWFVVGTYKTPSISVAKLLQIPALISGANNFKIVTLQSPCHDDNCEQATVALRNAAPLLFAKADEY